MWSTPAIFGRLSGYWITRDVHLGEAGGTLTTDTSRGNIVEGMPVELACTSIVWIETGPSAADCASSDVADILGVGAVQATVGNLAEYLVCSGEVVRERGV